MRRYGLVDIPDQASDIDAVPITRTITINGVTYDLSANRTWTTTSTNIYNTDGTLTGNRTLTHSTFSLTFAGTTSTRFHSNGNVTIGKTTDNGNKLQVIGQCDFGEIGVTNKGVIVYPSTQSNSLGVFKGLIWMSNVADVSMYIDCGGSNGLGSQPIRIFTDVYGGITTPFPICIQGNGRETIFGQDTITTNASSLVTMVSTTKGFLPPRMTSAQRTAISSPATGLVVYQTDGSAGLYLRNASAWVQLGTGSGNGTVTSVSVVSANGFAGTVANATTTPAITLSTTITGMLKGNGTAISAATAGTDYSDKNIYENDFFLTGERTLDLNTYNLHLSGAGGQSGTQYVFTKRGVVPGIQVLNLTSDRTLSSTTSAQNIFAASNNTLNTYGSETYLFEGIIYLTGMSATSGNITLDIIGNGTASPTSIMYFTIGADDSNVGTAGTLSGGVSITSSYTTPVTATTGTQLILKFQGIFRLDSIGGGTIIPRLSLANATAAVVKRNSYISMYPIGLDTAQKIEDL